MDKDFRSALKGKKLPVLTPDKKWYCLLDELGKNAVREYEEELNSLLKRQGKVNTDAKEIKLLKKKLMGEIMSMADEAEHDRSSKLNKKIENHKKLVEECNEKLELLQDEAKDIPKSIDQVNVELMINTMEYCYDVMQKNNAEIARINEWVSKIRVELKKRLVEKQMMEQRNADIYSYMHDIFGAEVTDLFDTVIEDKA